MDPVCSPPFVYGKAEYEHAIDAWTTHGIPSPSSEMSVCGMDGNWLYIIRRVIDNSIISVDQHHDSSKAKLRPDGVITVNNAVVGIVESKASESDLDTAERELTSKLHEAAHCRFPVGCSSIVGFTTCASMVRIHLIVHGNMLYSHHVLKTYPMESVGGRSDFIVDLFKLMRWMVLVKSSGALTHLIPGVKTQTRNGNSIFWGNAGLVKSFAREVRFNLMSQVYDLKHPNLEQGRTNGKSVTITSIGSTFQNAVASGQVTSRDQVLSQIQAALDAIHSIGIAHCDICLDNIFVLNDGTITLGDFEYCRAVTEPPPSVNRLFNNSDEQPPKTALDLDHNQFSKLDDELSEGYSLP
jgi:tRNA A-37 threonylcarbamoyl transferase component Bud32